MRTKYCPHCGSEKIHRVEEKEVQQFDVNIGIYYMLGGHYHECEECNETWEHHKNKLLLD
jgi:hypothetical protein